MMLFSNGSAQYRQVLKNVVEIKLQKEHANDALRISNQGQYSMSEECEKQI